MNQFKEITIKNPNINHIVKDDDVSGLVRQGKEKAFEIKINKIIKEKNDPCVDIEVALRKCKRVGVFSK